MTKRLHIEYKTALLYLILGALWILLSDRALLLFTQDAQFINELQTFKGWFFVFVTAIILFFYIRKYGRKIRSINEQLESGKKRYKALYSNAPLAYQSLDREGRIIDVNPTWCKVLGYTKEEATGTNFKDLLHDDFKEHFDANFEIFKNKGSISDVRFRIKKKNGNYILAAFEGFIGQHNNDQNIRTYCTFKDITEENEIKQQLIERESRYRAMFHENISVMLIVDLAGNILEANKAAQSFYGYSINEFLKLHFDELTNENQLFNELSQNLLQSKQSSFEQIHQLKSGTLRNALVYSSQINYKNQKVFYFIIHDITPRKQAESQLVLAKEKAEESSRLIRAFLNNISHEIRTPMNSILGFSQMLIRPGKDNDKKARYTRHIREGCNVLLEKVTDTIDISRVQTSNLKPVADNVNLKNLIEETVQQYLKSAKISNTIDTAFEHEEDNRLIYTDRYKLERIIKHLIDNALKYAPNSTVKITSRYKKDHFEIEISDNGPGIDYHMQEKIFEPFVKDLPDSTKVSEGTGIGLSIVKAFTEIIQGKLHLQSSPGSGTTFTLILPAKVDTN
ncbi:sensor histidine kinase [Salinivirga cyanobacteriivorans]